MDFNVSAINQFNRISDINSNIFLKGKVEDESVQEVNSPSFSDILSEKLNEVNDKQIESDILTQKMIQGDDVSIHEVMLAGEEAKISLQLAMQVRNKLVEAFQEINRTQI